MCTSWMYFGRNRDSAVLLQNMAAFLFGFGLDCLQYSVEHSLLRICDHVRAEDESTEFV